MRWRGPGGGGAGPAYAVGAQLAFGPPDVPAGLPSLVQGDRLGQRRLGVGPAVAGGQHHRQILKRGGQFAGRADRAAPRHRFGQRGRVGRPGLGRCPLAERVAQRRAR